MTFHAPEMDGGVTRKKTVGTKPGPSREEPKIIELCSNDSSQAELMATFGRSNRTTLRDQFLSPLLSNGLVEMTIPDRPKSRLQKYRLTAKGAALLAEMEKP